MTEVTPRRLDALEAAPLRARMRAELKKSKVGGNIINITAQLHSAWYQIIVTARAALRARRA